MRKPLHNCEARTIRLEIDSYNAILTYFRRSPSGMTGSEAIRRIVHAFGLHCQSKLDSGEIATSTDLANIPLTLRKILNVSETPK